MRSSTALDVGTGAALIKLANGTKLILIIHQALIDENPNQVESLLQPHQCRAHGVAIDDCAKRHRHIDGSNGDQCIKVLNHRIPLFYDGYKCYLLLSKPTLKDIERYPHVELTSPLMYEPDKRVYTRRSRTRGNNEDNLQRWRKNLGYPTLEVVKHTLKCTTRLVSTVEAETRDYMRDHYKPRLLCLRPHRINDICFSDTFFSSIRSVRGFTMFQMFSFLECGHDVPYLMRKESQASSKYRDLVREFGAPRAIVNDNAKIMTGDAWMKVCRDFCIESHTSEPYHQNENLAERRGGMLKHAIIKLFHYGHDAPLEFWCYALEYLALVRGCLARRSLGWKPPEELLFGETLDISVFRFSWFQPIWYYDPALSFPNDKMVAGHFLNIAPNVGDAFCYVIIPSTELQKFIKHKRYNPKVLTRSVVRERKESDTQAPIYVSNVGELEFTNLDGKILNHNDDIFNNVVSFADDSLSDYGEIIPEEIPDDLIVDNHGNIIIPPIQSDSDSIISTHLDGDSISESSILEEPNEFSNAEEIPHRIVDSVPAATPCDTPDPSNAPIDIPIISQTQDDLSVEKDDISITSQAEELNAHHINQYFSPDEDDFEYYDDILSHRWVDGVLELEVLYSTGESEFLIYDLVLDLDPLAVAHYIKRSSLGNDKATLKYARWARNFIRDVHRTMRRITRVRFQGSASPVLDINCHSRSSRRTNKAGHSPPNKKLKRKKKSKPGRNGRIPTTKFGVVIPRSFEHAVQLDRQNGNRLWQDAVEKEVAALIFHKCFEFKDPTYKPSSEYQFARLNLVFEVKQDLRRKMRLVIMGNLVDPRGLSTRATVVKGISVRLLSVIAHRDGLIELCGDIGNAFIQATTKEKVYTRCGPAFGDKEGCIALIVRALYGLTTSAQRFRTLLADFLRSLGFVPTRYDRDVWMRLRHSEDGYDYICTHVDDFKIVAKDPDYWLVKIKERFLVKTSGKPDYYLGNDYRFEGNEGIWTVGSKTYAAEAIRKVEEQMGVIPKANTPLPPKDCHPEMDESPLLGESDHRLFQMLVGMGNWLVVLGRFDLAFAMCSLSRFNACPREGHLILAKRVFSYLKKFPDRRIAIDSDDMDFSSVKEVLGGKPFRPDFIQDYPWAVEELDPNFPKAFGRTLQTTVLCDADHAHDLKTRRSVTGVLAFVGCTPVLWRSSRQSSVACSTYAAEFMALRTASEEAVSLRYMLRCLGIPIPNDGSAPTYLFGDNLGVIQNATNPEADLKKKHVALSFHFVREAIAAGITAPYWMEGKHNGSDITTKQIGSTEYLRHCDNLFWKPKHRH